MEAAMETTELEAAGLEAMLWQPRQWWPVLRDVALGENPGIAISFWWQVALLVLSVAALPFDRRIILGLNPWIKPIKFEISVSIFLLTVGLLLSGVGRMGKWRRSRLVLGWGFGVCMIVENTLIALQSARGVRSHMNFATVQDALVFSVMGLFIALNTLCAAWLLGLWSVTRTGLATTVVWGVRLGLVMLLLANAEGTRIVAHGGHTVGAADGGPGLPFLNWSKGHGDLRAAHFFALHCLQIFPLVGILLSRVRGGVVVLVAFALAYAAAVGWLFAEAVRGMPLLR